jgi:hypothetical protein
MNERIAARAQAASRPGGAFRLDAESESVLWTAMNQNRANPYWGEIEHYHNFGRTRLYALLEEAGFEPVRYAISERYRACMAVIARKR